ncbi:helix-turn-helix domain-containing protein [Streptomyces sp. PBH53]|uniref:helix-turn-helix domain-containing protein n=1 Tax=Streptomyces sp. PBH53 TaxID=1577075 RepID=UPI000B2BCE3C|nr:helix-turn-helix transcriptional regulator [Streptomyces sp. PBH53]
MSTENRLRRQPVPDGSSEGFDAVMDSIDRLTDEERAALTLQADQAELGYEAYALALDLLELGHQDRALRWLRTAARYHVTGAQLLLRPRSMSPVVYDEVPSAGSRAREQKMSDCGPMPPTVTTTSPGITHPSASSPLTPTAQRIVLGTELRELRRTRQITMNQAARTTRCSLSALSRIEQGMSVPKSGLLERLLTLYGVDDPEERRRLLNALYMANERSWWDEYSDIMPVWLQTLFDLERSACLIKTFEARVVPGLLQTAEYARAITRVGNPWASDQEIDRRVQLRIKRQRLLQTADAPKLWALLDESVLRRQVGGSTVMRDQLRHLMRMSQRPNVTLQILPLQAYVHPDISAPVTVLQFAEPALPDVVYLEQLSGATYLSSSHASDSYRRLMDQLTVAAEKPHHTEDILYGILDRAGTAQVSTVPDADTRVYTEFMERISADAPPPKFTEEILGDLIAACS